MADSDSDSDSSSEGEVAEDASLHEVNDKLCQQFIKYEKTSCPALKKLNEVGLEKEILAVKLEESIGLVETLITEDSLLVSKFKVLSVI